MWLESNSMHDFFLHKTLNFTEVLLCDETLVSLIPPGPNCRGKCEKNAINVFRYHQCLTATHSRSHCGPLPWLSLSPLHTPSLCCSMGIATFAPSSLSLLDSVPTKYHWCWESISDQRATEQVCLSSNVSQLYQLLRKTSFSIIHISGQSKAEEGSVQGTF